MGDKVDDRKLVEDAYRKHHDQVYRYLLRRSGSLVDAEELTQTVFADAAAALAHNRPNSILAWLYAVAERRFIDELRRRRRRAEVPLPDEGAADEPGYDLGYGPEVARALVLAVEQLPADQRGVVVMRLLEDRPFAEIAATLDVTEAACKMRFSRGLASLRDLLRSRGVEP